MPDIIPVILCGGSGTRLWPLSRELCPKQFVDFGEKPTLFAQAMRRMQSLPGCKRAVVVCNEAHRFHALHGLQACGLQADVLLEPEPRNTAPAIAVASLFLREWEEDPLMLVLPADHALDDDAAFCQKVLQAVPLAEDGAIVTFGIMPTGPETGYGYIEQGEAVGAGFHVARFVEKPDAATAESILAQGNYVWNSGMFLLRASVFLEELARHVPDMDTGCRAAWRDRQTDGTFIRPGRNAFLAVPSDSIDYAVMEKTERAVVMPLALNWSDLGSWEALFQNSDRDAQDNAVTGDVLLEDTEGCYLNAQHRLLAVLGVRDLVVVETKDAVLVLPRQSAQDIKKLFSRLQHARRPECHQSTLVHRPWGSYESLASGDRFQVKRIIVQPGEELSLQKHHHRAEHWIVVSGTAEVTNGDEVSLFSEGQGTYIPLGAVHRLKNPGVIPLVLIEVQSGPYTGEDDIVRLADVYGRS